MIESAARIARRRGDVVKIFGKFLLWVLAYALGAALIFFVARRPAPPVNPPEPAPQAEAPAESSRADEPAGGETLPPEPAAAEPATTREEASAPPAPAPDAALQPSSPPRRVKAVRIPTR